MRCYTLAYMFERMIKSEGTVMSYPMKLNDLNVRVEAQKNVRGSFTDVNTLTVEVDTLQNELIQIQFVDISTHWGEVSLPNAPGMPSAVHLLLCLRMKGMRRSWTRKHMRRS